MNLTEAEQRDLESPMKIMGKSELCKPKQWQEVDLSSLYGQCIHTIEMDMMAVRVCACCISYSHN